MSQTPSPRGDSRLTSSETFLAEATRRIERFIKRHGESMLHKLIPEEARALTQQFMMHDHRSLFRWISDTDAQIGIVLTELGLPPTISQARAELNRLRDQPQSEGD